MGIDFKPLNEAIGAEILSVDLSRPLDPATFRDIRRIWLDHNIILFREQDLMPEHMIAFCRLLGSIEYHTLSDYQLPGYPEVFIITNMELAGRPMGAQKAGRFWHSDSQFLAVPSAGTFLYAKKVPEEGGETFYANMYAAYESLSDNLKARIDPLRATFSRVKSWEIAYTNRAPMTEEQKAAFPDVTHPVIRTHPESGRTALYIGSWQERVRIEDLPEDEGETLGRVLLEHATGPEFVYGHRWKVGDAILWDNRCAMHCAMPFDESRDRRLMHRVTLKGSVPCRLDEASGGMDGPSRLAGAD